MLSMNQNWNIQIDWGVQGFKPRNSVGWVCLFSVTTQLKAEWDVQEESLCHFELGLFCTEVPEIFLVTFSLIENYCPACFFSCQFALFFLIKHSTELSVAYCQWSQTVTTEVIVAVCIWLVFGFFLVLILITMNVLYLFSDVLFLSQRMIQITFLCKLSSTH